MPLGFAIVLRWRRIVLVVSYALSNAIFELRGGLNTGENFDRATTTRSDERPKVRPRV
jgi:hypothetical protein